MNSASALSALTALGKLPPRKLAVVAYWIGKTPSCMVAMLGAHHPDPGIARRVLKQERRFARRRQRQHFKDEDSAKLFLIFFHFKRLFFLFTHFVSIITPEKVFLYTLG